MCTKNEILDFIKLRDVVEKEEQSLSEKRKEFEETIKTNVELLNLKKEKLETTKTKIIEQLSTLKNKKTKVEHYTLSLIEKISPDVPKASTPLRKKLEEWLRDNKLLASCSSLSISLVKKLLKSLTDQKQLEELNSIIPIKVDQKLKIEILP